MDHIKILLSPGQNVNEKTFNNYDTFKKKKKTAQRIHVDTLVFISQNYGVLNSYFLSIAGQPRLPKQNKQADPI